MRIEGVSGIYRIRNLINEKIYIGSAENMGRRRREHWKELRNQIHCNPHLQSSWDKYGKDNFVFEMVEECSIEILIERENHWLRTLGLPNHDIGYNIRKEASSNLGLVHSPETLANLSEIQHAYRQTEEGRASLLRACKMGGEKVRDSGQLAKNTAKATKHNKLGQAKSFLQALKACLGMKKKHAQNRARKKE